MKPEDPLLRQVRESAGKRAREESLMLDRMVEGMRLTSFRDFLAATVTSMSAPVPDILALVGSDVFKAGRSLRPAHMWPRVTGIEKHYLRARTKTTRSKTEADVVLGPAAPIMGDAVVSDGAFGPWIQARVIGGSLDVILRDGRFALFTQDGTAHLRLGAALPDAVITACKGRALDEVVDHPLLSGRGFVIDAVAASREAAVLVFEVGCLPLELPWRF